MVLYPYFCLMKFVYDIAVTTLSKVLELFAPANQKLNQLVSGRKEWADRLKMFRHAYSGKLAWFHVASLGEYEQAKPVISAFKLRFPAYGVVVSFFSPSGFEHVSQRQQPDVNFITYLPFDTPSAAEEFIKLLHPSIGFFVKYDLWANHLLAAKQAGIPLFLFSASMRKDQIYFKGYGGFFRKQLFSFDYIFTQNSQTVSLLNSIGLKNVSITGDTRYDRVKELSENPRHFPEIEALIGGRRTVVIGSAWDADMNLLIPLINVQQGIFWIIAPHDLNSDKMTKWQAKIQKSAIRLSELQDNGTTDVLLIDNIGMLSSLYQYAYLAYVGGAFGKGLHNILEPLAFKIPVLFGSVKQKSKFPEAEVSQQYGCGFRVKDPEELQKVFNLLLEPTAYQAACEAAEVLVKDNTGSAGKIIDCVEALISRR
jgi:3-deoxy-D-manno-octulosonic-acid transferase